MALILLLLLSCTKDEAVDTGACAQSAVSWDSFGQGFLITHCQGCHASTSPQRYGAPEGIAFDTREQAAELEASIARTVLEQETMPPAGGLNDEERALLEQWLACGI